MMKIWPNPVGSILVISSSVTEIRSLKVTDMVGSVRLESACTGRRVEADLSFLPAGFYMLQVATDQEVISSMIMKN